MLDRSCSCCPTLPTSRGGKINAMNSCVWGAGLGRSSGAPGHCVPKACTSLEISLGKAQKEARQEVPKCSLTERFHKSKNHYSWSLDSVQQVPLERSMAWRNIIIINTPILAPQEPAQPQGGSPPMEKASPKEWRAVNFSGKVTGISCSEEIRGQTGRHKFDPAVTSYAATDRWLLQGFLVSFSIYWLWYQPGDHYRILASCNGCF